MMSLNHMRMTKGWLTMVVSAALLAAVVAGAVPAATGGSSGLYNVQIFISTAASHEYSYYVSAYNSTGSLVVSYSTPYPAASFELPAGKYLFTVSAVGQYPYCKLCMTPGSSGSGSSTTTSGGTTGSMVIPYPLQQSSEYGYLLVEVTGAASYTAETRNITDYPTSNVLVSVKYANGTAAPGAEVSAYVIGEWYSWWGPNSTLIMSGQTDSNGQVTLVLPAAPSVVSAWKWVPVNVSMGSTSVPVNVGGEKANVTGYWQTTYVGLAASAVWYPPASGLDMTLRYQQPNFWVMPMGQAEATTSGATVSNAASGVPAETQKSSSYDYYLPSTLPQTQTGSQGGTSPPALQTGPAPWTLSTVGGAVLVATAAVAAGLAVALAMRRHTVSPALAAV